MKKESLTKHGIRRGDRQLMVDMNRNLVLNVLRTGAASRAEVVRATGLSPATVSTIVAELIASSLWSRADRESRPAAVRRRR